MGGKRQLLAELRRRVPASFGAYHEPFVGGGALFFALAPPVATLGDANERLVRTYQGVKHRVDDVVAKLGELTHDRATFERVRAQEVDAEDDATVAAWMIYLNRTGYNGLYRVNSRNVFNVPFGAHVNPTICDAGNLRACARALAGAAVVRGDFRGVLERAAPGDFVYFDPPYVPLSPTSSFTTYTGVGFTLDDHRDLRDVALELKGRGVHVLLSNSSAPEVERLYEQGFEHARVSASRAVNCQPGGRGKVAELLIW